MLEIAKLIYIPFMRADAEMNVPDYDTKSIRGFEAHTMNLLEEMAQIDYVFCDKTGTLTKNELVFKKLSIVEGD